MDYIQKDLELIRMASGEGRAGDKEKKSLKKEKNAGRAGDKEKKSLKKEKNAGDPARSKSESRLQSKSKTKVARKTLSPKQTKKEKPGLQQKEKNVRRSMGSNAKKSTPALGKIKFPAMKKLTLQPPDKAAHPTRSVKETPPPALPPKVALREAPSKTRKALDPNAIPIEGICFEEGAKIEAVDHGQWYRGKIVQVDHQKMDILVHFDGWGSRFDTWFPMTSALIRGRTQLDSKPDMRNYESGEDVLATWTDGNFYPATVLSVKSSGSCQVMYYDGLKKLVRPNLIKKMSEKEKEAAMQAAQKLLLMPPVDIGSPASGSLDATLTSSKFRKYKTSANDREQRIAARSGTSTPATTPKLVERGPRKRAMKRKAVSVFEPQTTGNKTSETGTMATETPLSKRTISDSETFVTKKARLDKIASNLVSKVSPHSKKDKEKAPQSVATFIVKMKEKDAKYDSSQPFKYDNEFSTPKAPPAQVSETSDCTAVVVGKKLPSKQENIERLCEQKPKELTKSQPPTQKDKVDLNESAGTKLKSLAAMVTESVSPDSTPSPPGGTTFKVGDIVLAKWADCRSYLAYIIKKESHDHYRIRYYDGMVKVVKGSFIHPWIGPLPDALKSFKHKAPAAQSIRNRSADFKSARSKSVTTTTVESKAVLPRRRTIPGAKTEVSPPPVRRRRQSETKETASVSDIIQFAIGEKVVAKWTDLRWYPATVVSKKDNEYYEVRYHDKMTKIVRDTWLNRWAPTPSQKSKSKPAVKVPDKSTETLPEGDHGRENSIADRKTEEVEDNTAAISQGVGQSQILTVQTAEGSAQRKAVGRKRFWYVPGSSVLAKYTDGKRYPATVRECLENQQYTVEFDNGVRCTVKTSMLKPWNPLALPPITKYYKKKLDLPQGSNTPSSTVQPTPSPISIKLKVPESDDTKEKPARLQSSKPSQMPRQVVRGYQAYYSRLPEQTVDNVERRLFTCRVPQCTKRFRKENMLRQHHKVYHQKRYKLRYQKSDLAPIKRKSLKAEKIIKAEKIRRRVSADYEELSQNVDFLALSVANVEKQQPSQGSLESSPTVTNVRAETKISAKSEFKDAISSSTPSEFLPSTSKEPTMDKKRARKRRRQTSTKSDGAVESLLEETLTPVEATPPDPEVENEPPPAANEDVIRCSCRSEEEEGLMIQCEGCFTWQHIGCIRFDHQDKNESVDDKTDMAENTEDSKNTIPKTAVDGESYICWVCKNPQNVRKTRKYLYSNDFLLKGKLPSLANIVNISKQMDKPSKSAFDPTMLSSLLDEVTKMQEALYGIKQKIILTKAVDENVLLQTWEDLGVTNKEKMPSGIEDRNPSSTADKESDVTPVSTDQTPEKKQEESGIQKRKRKFSNGKGSSLPLKISGENHEAYILRCRENLLDHIAEMEAELSDRITRLTDFVSTLQSSPDEDEGISVHDLQRDLSVVQTLLAKC